MPGVIEMPIKTMLLATVAATSLAACGQPAPEAVTAPDVTTTTETTTSDTVPVPADSDTMRREGATPAETDETGARRSIDT